MNKNIKFLNYIYKNAEMGEISNSQLLNSIKDPTFKIVIEFQLHEYLMVLSKTKALLYKFKGEIKGINKLAKMSTNMMIHMKTLTNHSPSHISDMLIQGSTMGIIDITKNLHKYKVADQEIIALANFLLHIERQNIESLKKFL